MIYLWFNFGLHHKQCLRKWTAFQLELPDKFKGIRYSNLTECYKEISFLPLLYLIILLYFKPDPNHIEMTFWDLQWFQWASSQPSEAWETVTPNIAALYLSFTVFSRCSRAIGDSIRSCSYPTGLALMLSVW